MNARAPKVLRMRLDRCPDPLHAYAALTGHGTVAGTALLESADTGHGGTRRSLLALSTALRIVLTGDAVIARAQGANGRAALSLLGCGDDELRIPVPAPDVVPLEAHARLLAPGAFDPLRRILDGLRPARPEDRACLMLVGATAFELADRFEHDARAGIDAPDYLFMMPDVVLDIDHLRGRAELVALAFDERSGNDLARRLGTLADTLSAPMPGIDGPPDAPRMERPHAVNLDDEAFCRNVELGRAAVRAGEVFQVVLSRHWSLPCPDPLDAYMRLRRDNPSPYLFYLHDDEITLFGASPESALRVDAATRTLEIYPVAGTRARGADPDQDARIEAELRQDTKELAEHMMLVDLARNDIARVCEPGSRSVPLMLGVDRYAHVMHLVSRVRGRLRDGIDALHALRACLNMGTLTGAPKLRASKLIREIEGEPRGFYGGAVGVLDGAGNLDTAITIRAAEVRDGIARVQAGAGIVIGSDPQREADETSAKARAVTRAVMGERACA